MARKPMTRMDWPQYTRGTMQSGRWLATCTLIVAAGSTPALAWHIAGTVYCDKNDSNTIDGPDTALAGYTAKVTSQVANPGAMSTDLTDGSGFYSIGLPDSNDTYGVTLSGLPVGQTIRVPGGGSYTITLDLNQDHRDGVNFLVGGCAPQSTTTTTSTPGTTNTTSTSSTSTTTSSQPCPTIPFILCEGGEINNDADIFSNIAASEPDATLRISQHSFMSNGTAAIGNRVEIGDDSDVFSVRTNDFHRGDNVSVRSGVFAPPPFPLVTPCCPIPPITCGNGPVVVRRNETFSITPGTYGALRVLNGGTLNLAAGTYTFCSIKVGRDARIVAQGPVTINVESTVRVGADSHLEPLMGQPALIVNVAGKKIKLTQNSVTRAFFTAPNAQIRLGRSANVQGGFCVKSAQTDKHTTLQCP
jgi:hypothetical protein